MANVRFDGSDDTYRVKIRNLSSGGMMAEGDLQVVRGAKLEIELRNVGKVDGSVAWVQDNRFGIAFANEIDAKEVRAPVTSSETVAPRFVRTPIAHPASDADKLKNIRKL
ncbi:PilZ domain-containing protein [Alteripontixanthobacter maritimus]|nr:PilZ domain-containing protein [Alteripontixanthobacter maritimus]